MKTFNDLNFKPHSFDPTGLQARMFFPNGYGISVVRFRGSYTSNDSEWEAAVLEGDENDSSLCYDTEITDDVVGHLSAQEVTEMMERIQSL